MAQIDLDDLPPKIAQMLATLADGEELLLVQHGAVVARLKSGDVRAPASGGEVGDLPPEERIKEVLDQFNAMIHDEF
jgi:antitoxin (DNA-binding transcriptional repressor) of toxin-antitoxin stability system